MPPAATKSKFAKICKYYILTKPHLQKHVSKFGITTQTLNIALYMKVEQNTDKWKDSGQSDY